MNRGAILLQAVPNVVGSGLSLKADPGRWVWIAGVAQEGYSEQFPAQAVWIVNHNLGRCPSAVSVRTLGGILCDADIRHASVNQIRIYFDVPTAGVCDVS